MLYLTLNTKKTGCPPSLERIRSWWSVRVGSLNEDGRFLPWCCRQRGANFSESELNVNPFWFQGMTNCCPKEVYMLTCGWSSSRPTTRIPPQIPKQKIASLRNYSHHPPLQPTKGIECIYCLRHQSVFFVLVRVDTLCKSHTENTERRGDVIYFRKCSCNVRSGRKGKVPLKNYYYQMYGNTHSC